MSGFTFEDGSEMVVPERGHDEDGTEYFWCPECDREWDENDRHHPDFDPTPAEQWEVTEGWTPPSTGLPKKDQHNPEGL